MSVYNILLPVLIGFFSWISNNQTNPIYLYSYFVGNGEDGLHLAYSKDGYHYEALNQGKSLLKPEVGKDKLMRDPCIIQDLHGRYHMVWTVSWNERGIGYAWSDDLIHWSDQKYIPVMHHEPSARNAWAPEIFFDQKNKLFLIYWSSTVPDKYPATDTLTERGYNHRIYATTTTDFNTFTETKLFYDPGFNVIDATILKLGKKYKMVIKNETPKPVAEKNLRIAESNSLGNFGLASPPITGSWVEGPSVLKLNKKWIIYFDQYRDKKMGAIESRDFIHWTDISTSIHFPQGTRHGTIFKTNQKIFNKLLKFSLN